MIGFLQMHRRKHHLQRCPLFHTALLRADLKLNLKGFIGSIYDKRDLTLLRRKLVNADHDRDHRFISHKIIFGKNRFPNENTGISAADLSINISKALFFDHNILCDIFLLVYYTDRLSFRL